MDKHIDELLKSIDKGNLSVYLYGSIEDCITNDQRENIMSAYVNYMEKNWSSDTMCNNLEILGNLCAVFAGNKPSEYNKIRYKIKNIIEKTS